MLGYNVDSPNENTLIRLQTANGSDSQRWIIEYAGGEDGDGNAANGNERHYYNIRNVGCGRMLRINNQHAKFGYATGNKYDNTVYWRLVYNDADDTYMLHSWDVLKNKSPNSGYAYMTPVTGANSGVKSETEGAPLQALSAYYGFELKRIMVQDYGAYELESGTYRVQGDGTLDGTLDSYWTAVSNSVPEPVNPDAPNANWAITNGLKYVPNSSLLTDGTQLFVFDQTSGGYVTFFDAKTGRYIGDRLRFYWIPIPDYDGITRLDSYYLCNVLTGKCLYMGYVAGEGDVIRTDLISRSPWTFTKQTSSTIYTENADQGYNGNTDVYLDSIDQSNTIKLPIKIYDYVNDGMLFEYAQYVGNDSNGNPKPTETISGKLYRLGNNRAYAFQAGSNGGSWSGISSGYYAGKNEADAWNTYKTFTLGKVWAKYSNDSDWYTQDGSPIGKVNGVTFNSNRYEYNWEAYGLGAFRGQSTAMDPDSASIYFMYGYRYACQREGLQYRRRQLQYDRYPQ